MWFVHLPVEIDGLLFGPEHRPHSFTFLRWCARIAGRATVRRADRSVRALRTSGDGLVGLFRGLWVRLRPPLQARMAELADASDSKSDVLWTCGFKSHSGYSIFLAHLSVVWARMTGV